MRDFVKMKEHPLTSDELGEKGESRFKEMCADAKLICNKSDRDRAGWDFLIEFPFASQVPLSLDNRVAPPSCHIQVKTVCGSTSRVKVKLNMAERLAKELKPSFLYIMKVADDLTVSETYLLHMQGDRLGAVLKRLRKESVAGTPAEDLNKKFIYFTPKAGERIEPNGSALRKALEAACGENLHDYVQKKRHELQTLGFKGAKYEGQMTLTAKNMSELVDIFLGIRKSVPVDNFQTFENRFDIKIQNLPAQVATVTIDPQPIDQCRIVVRGDDGLPPAIFNADIFVVPSFMTAGRQRYHIRSALFCVDLVGEAEGVRPQFRFDIANKCATPELWWSYWRTLRAISNNAGVIEIIPVKMQDPVIIDIRRADEMQVYGFDAHLELCDSLSRIFRYAGLGSVPEFEWRPMEAQSPQITLLDELMQGGFDSFSSTFETNAALTGLNGSRVIAANQISFGVEVLAYYSMAAVDVAIDGAQSEIKFSDFVFRKAKLICGNEEEFSQFIDEAKRVEKVDVVCNLAPTA
ncbi:hypothetical protein [Burkholderia thailandensis]|uniref:hypothetical protein n=1 Tax=Burkholderia thailandensis TaxID=57975 RepID=UPI001378D954|nr:hypothetical protein [Burkholderia thailandensis]